MTDYSIKLAIRLSVNVNDSYPSNPPLGFEESIKEEISIFCSRLERLRETNNFVFLSSEQIKVEEY